MYTLKLRHLVVACVAVYISLPAGAQQQSGGPPQQPPQLERLDEGEAPAVTDRKPEPPRSVVTEKRAYGGRVTEIEVQSGRSTYYLQPNTQGGSAMPGETDSSRMRAPQWRIGEFDLRRGEEARKAADPSAAGVPPPPTAPPRK